MGISRFSFLREFTAFAVVAGGLLQPAAAAADSHDVREKLKAKKGKPNSCIDCHRDPKFRVTNKKLFSYWNNWNLSVHDQEGLTCDDCHGGYPDKKDKDEAHGTKGKLSADNPESAVNFKNVPDTCKQCHEGIYEAYALSDHFTEYRKEGEAPHCVTCHGSLNNKILSPNDVKEFCATCHNEKEDISPEVPEEADRILHRYIASRRYYHWILKRGGLHVSAAELKVLDEQVAAAGLKWHTFDIEAVDKNIQRLRLGLKNKRKEIVRRQHETAPAAGDSACKCECKPAAPEDTRF